MEPAATRATPVIVAGGEPHVVLSSYPAWNGAQLHSLAGPARYRCPCCRQHRESTLIATTADGTPACPACYPRLGEQPAPATGNGQEARAG